MRASLRRARSITQILALAMMVFSGLALKTQAVVDAHSQANTNAPPDGSPWGNVGMLNGASGTYLGAGWVLTAAHVGVGNIVLNGTTYIYDGTSHRLTNSDGTSTDMVLFHLNTLPPLPRLLLTSNTPSILSEVDMIGSGRIAGSTETLISNYTGFYWSGVGFHSWGNNTVTGTTTTDAGYGTVTLFSTQFDTPGPGTTSDEAQAAAGDSGGGVFAKGGANWELVGMLDLRADMPNQPAGTSVYGDVTYAIDIATYRNEIVAHIQATVPPLSISQSRLYVQVCWPDTGIAYNLQVSPTLSPLTWTTANGSVSLSNGQFCSLLNLTNTASVFRLQSQ